jgi:hypothetical protein
MSPRVRTHKGKIDKEEGRNSVKGQKKELIREKAFGQIRRYFPKGLKWRDLPKFCKSWQREVRKF